MILETTKNKSKSSYELRIRSNEAIQFFNMPGSPGWLLNSFKAVPEVISKVKLLQSLVASPAMSSLNLTSHRVTCSIRGLITYT